MHTDCSLNVSNIPETQLLKEQKRITFSIALYCIHILPGWKPGWYSLLKMILQWWKMKRKSLPQTMVPTQCAVGLRSAHRSAASCTGWPLTGSLRHFYLELCKILQGLCAVSHDSTWWNQVMVPPWRNCDNHKSGNHCPRKCLLTSSFKQFSVHPIAIVILCRQW